MAKILLVYTLHMETSKIFRKRLKFHVVNIYTDLLHFEFSIRDDKKVRNFIWNTKISLNNFMISFKDQLISLIANSVM